MAAAKGNNYVEKRKWHPGYTDAQLKELADDLIEYAETSKSIHLAPWCRKHNKSLPWLNELAKTHNIIADAHIKAKELLSAKILNSSFYNEANATVGMTYLPIYDSEFKDYIKWKSELSKESDNVDLKKVFDDLLTGITKLAEKPTSKNPVKSKVATK